MSQRRIGPEVRGRFYNESALRTGARLVKASKGAEKSESERILIKLARSQRRLVMVCYVFWISIFHVYMPDRDRRSKWKGLYL